jgi:hypothetical protein
MYMPQSANTTHFVLFALKQLFSGLIVLARAALGYGREFCNGRTESKI